MEYIDNILFVAKSKIDTNISIFDFMKKIVHFFNPVAKRIF